MASGRKAIVVGAGVIGLTTAVTAQGAGFEVEVVTPTPTMETTSSKAGASFKPHEVAYDSNTDSLLRETKGAFARIVSDLEGSGVRRHVHWEASSSERELPAYWEVMDDFQTLKHPDVPGGYAYGWKYTTFFIDTPVFLPWLAGRFAEQGGRLTFLRRPFEDLTELAALPADVIFNCTGLGAKTLCKDNRLLPIKGQIVVTDPTPGMDWSISADGFYVYPRETDTVLGGSTEWHVDDESVEVAAIHLIIRGNKRILPALSLESVRRTYAGLRPYRAGGIRLEAERLLGRQIVHNYGHGGSGFTLSWGSAQAAVDLSLG